MKLNLQGKLFDHFSKIEDPRIERTKRHKLMHTFDQTVDKGHGRVEIRRCWTMGQVGYLVDADKWEKFTSLGTIQAERVFKVKSSAKCATTLAV